MTSFLFFGPLANTKSLEFASSLGRPFCPPIGVEGLKAEEARELSTLLSDPPRFSGERYILIGPMDQANEFACDALLKVLEEPRTKLILVLWAYDVHRVPLTIQSRVTLQWCPGTKEPSLQDATQCLKYYSDQHWAELIALISKIEDIPNFLESFCYLLSQRGGGPFLEKWSKFRTILTYDKPTYFDVINALIN
jgi:hypothetical protein